MTDPLLNILTLLIKVLILLTVPTQTQGQAFGFADKDKNSTVILYQASRLLQLFHKTHI